MQGGEREVGVHGELAGCSHGMPLQLAMVARVVFQCRLERAPRHVVRGQHQQLPLQS